MLQTSVHDSLGVHVLESQADLTEVLPDCLLGNQSTLPLEVLCAVVVVVCSCCLQLFLLLLLRAVVVAVWIW